MENYFWNTECAAPEAKVYILIIYDIVDNKRRTAFAKKLNGYGMRVQKSAFEALVSKKLYEKLLKEIPRCIAQEDSVRVYKMIGSGEVSFFGTNVSVSNEEVVII